LESDLGEERDVGGVEVWEEGVLRTLAYAVSVEEFRVLAPGAL